MPRSSKSIPHKLHLQKNKNLAVGTAVIQMEASVDELIASVGKTLEELKAKIADNS